MKLYERERRILACVELQADKPLKLISRQTGYREHTVRYNLKRLYEREIISQRRPIIDMNRLGYINYNLFFSLTSESQKRKDNFVQYLLASPYVTWMFELGGDFRYGISISVKHITSIGEFLELLSKEFGNIFFEKLFTVELSYQYYGRRYLSSETFLKAPLSFQVARTPEELDEQDAKILNALANSRYSSYTELADSLKIPLPTFERRRHRLEQSGIIKGYSYWVSASRLGMEPYIILIYVRGINPKFKLELNRFARDEVRVVYVIESMGNWDYELGIEVQSNKDLTLITERLYDQFGTDLKTIKVVPILDYLKFKSFPG